MLVAHHHQSGRDPRQKPSDDPARFQAPWTQNEHLKILSEEEAPFHATLARSLGIIGVSAVLALVA
jgi:hypothetical protein